MDCNYVQVVRILTVELFLFTYTRTFLLRIVFDSVWLVRSTPSSWFDSQLCNAIIHL